MMQSENAIQDNPSQYGYAWAPPVAPTLAPSPPVTATEPPVKTNNRKWVFYVMQNKKAAQRLARKRGYLESKKGAKDKKSSKSKALNDVSIRWLPQSSQVSQRQSWQAVAQSPARMSYRSPAPVQQQVVWRPAPVPAPAPRPVVSWASASATRQLYVPAPAPAPRPVQVWAPSPSPVNGRQGVGSGAGISFLNTKPFST